MMTRIPPIVVVLLAGALAFLSIRGVRFSSELYEMLPADLPEVRGMEQVDRFFSRHGQLIVTIEGEAAWAVESAGASLAEHLRGEEELVRDVFRELSLEEMVTKGGDLLAWAWLNGEPEKLEALRDGLAPGASVDVIARSLETVQDGLFVERALVAGYDPLGLARLKGGTEQVRIDPMRSQDGRFEVLYVEGVGVDFSDYRASKRWLELIRKSVHAWSTAWLRDEGPEAAIVTGLTGTPAFMGEVGTEMERDMTISVGLTLALISLLFFVMHRQLRPLSWLLATMMVVLAVTLQLGAFLYGQLSVMSVGFAAILMGLAVDYGIVLYREAMASGGPVGRLRRAVGPGIFWAAATTAVVFLALNLSSLPGLAEMGNLVAIGVLVGALVMVFLFGPVAVEFTREGRESGLERAPSRARPGVGWVIVAVAVPLMALGTSWWAGAPGLEANFHPFRMRESPSMTAWKTLERQLRGDGHAVPAVVTAESLPLLHEGLSEFEDRVAQASSAGLIRRSMSPREWVPNPDHQARNAAVLRELLSERSRLLEEIDAAGFSEDGRTLARSVFEAWEYYLGAREQEGWVLPRGRLARWSVDRLYQRDQDEVAALAAVVPTTTGSRDWVEAVCDDRVAVASLGSLGTALNERIGQDVVRVFGPMMALLVIMLALVFRSWRDLLLSVWCLVFSAGVLVLLTVSGVLRWNSFNVCGLPLLFGTGLDFSIHMILALRRGEGVARVVRQGMGRAVLFCGLSSAIGFGSLATASAHGLSSLGVVCAAGILVNMSVAIWLLPAWFRWLHRIAD